MKTKTIQKSKLFLALIFTVIFSFTTMAQDADLITNAKEALTAMLKESPKLKSIQSAAYGYAVFPKIIKAGIGIGGAGGKGVVYKGHGITGMSKLSQASIGAQLGGQQYSEVIFFENKDSYDNFTGGKLKFDAQASAVAINADVGVEVPYRKGVVVFTMAKGGLMYSASIGGQKFKFEAK